MKETHLNNFQVYSILQLVLNVNHDLQNSESHMDGPNYESEYDFVLIARKFYVILWHVTSLCCISLFLSGIYVDVRTLRNV